MVEIKEFDSNPKPDSYWYERGWHIVNSEGLNCGIIVRIAERYDVLFDSDKHWHANIGGLDNIEMALAHARMVVE